MCETELQNCRPGPIWADTCFVEIKSKKRYYSPIQTQILLHRRENIMFCRENLLDNCNAKILFCLIILLSFVFIACKSDKPTIIPYKKGSKFGFRDANKKVLVEPKYDKAYPFVEGFAIVEVDRNSGFIDESGKEIVPLGKYSVFDRYGYSSNFSDGMAKLILSETNKYGFINKTGKEVVPFKYDDAEGFSEGLAAVKLNDKWGFVDKSGNEVISLKYDDVDKFTEGLAKVKLNNKLGYVDKSGNEVVPPKYDDAGNFSEGLAIVKLNGKYGSVDKSGNEVISIKYDEAGEFSEGLAAVKLNTYWGYVDKTGKEVFMPIKNERTSLPYDEAFRFSEGLARVKFLKRYSFIDKTSKEIIPSLKYLEVRDFSKEGLALVKGSVSEKRKNEYGFDVVYQVEKWGFIDRSGTEVIPLKYDFAESFSGGLAKVGFEKVVKPISAVTETGEPILLRPGEPYVLPPGATLLPPIINENYFYIGKDGTEYYEPSPKQ